MQVSPVNVDLVVGGRQLTEPRLAPDGRRLAYVVSEAGDSHLAVVDLDAAVDGAGRPRAVVLDPVPAPGRGFGGGAFEWLPDGHRVVYVGDDGALWLADLDAEDADPRRVWPADGTGDGAAEGGAQAPAVSPDGSAVVFMVDQRHVVVAGVERGLDGVGATVLTAGAGPDFSFDPVFSPDGTRVAFQGWSVPDMAWDGAVRMTARADGTGPIEVWSPGADAAVQQPGFAPDGTPVAITDASGWLNVWFGDRPLLGDGEPFEHAGPTWGPRQRSWCSSPDGRRVAFCRNEHGFGRLCMAEVTTGAVTELGRGVHGQLSWQGDRLAALRSGARTPTEVVVYDVGSRASGPSRQTVDVGPDPAWAGVGLTEPTVLSIGDAPTVPARLYHRTVASAPYSPVGGGAPPRLLVWVHGGPTSQWDVSFNPGVAFWTSRGWDVLLVDPRGSTGHGRSYQQGLRGGWGVVDVADTAAAIAHAHGAGWAGPDRTVIMGGSSGGLTVLAVLGHHGHLVAGGVALYPVSDIADLSIRSHRFERHYNLTLVGPEATADERAVYAQRSPLRYAERIAAPLLVLHGTADQVIPADQSIELAARIRHAGGAIELHLLDGEGHGFRQPHAKRAEYRLVESFLDRVVTR